MWVTRRTDYATRAVLALAMADGALNLDQLAEATEAPRSVLEQVMPALRAAGIVRSVRGPGGGYRLNHPPEELTLERVVRIFEGQLAPIGYATRHEPEPCPAIVGRSLRPAWEQVRDATITILSEITFEDLAEAAREEPEPSLARKARRA
ncbi:MAG TPA: Rrf2 family transcriptional regulator [Gaiellaceae bacterium]|jgi:Rrf2 family protein|nr:Rrf2 family transcriptional regulator [Gaiellaceae bacterium]